MLFSRAILGTPLSFSGGRFHSGLRELPLVSKTVGTVTLDRSGSRGRAVRPQSITPERLMVTGATPHPPHEDPGSSGSSCSRLTEAANPRCDHRDEPAHAESSQNFRPSPASKETRREMKERPVWRAHEHNGSDPIKRPTEIEGPASPRHRSIYRQTVDQPLIEDA